jgi:hypothetical protein
MNKDRCVLGRDAPFGRHGPNVIRVTGNIDLRIKTLNLVNVVVIHRSQEQEQHAGAGFVPLVVFY